MERSGTNLNALLGAKEIVVAKITLTDDEVRAVLAKALAEKTQYVLGEFDPEECYFTVTSTSGEVEDVEEVTFTGSA